jgi:hypothetical protein
MALKRISDYTAATTPLAGTEMLEVETAAGVSRKTTAQAIANLASGSSTFPVAIQVAASDEVTSITAGVSKLTFRAPYAFTLTGARASLSTASSSGNPVIDVNKNGTSVLSTKISIDATEKTSVTAATPPVISTSAFADDDEITIDVDTAGTGAKGLKVTLIGTKP